MKQAIAFLYQLSAATSIVRHKKEGGVEMTKEEVLAVMNEKMQTFRQERDSLVHLSHPYLEESGSLGRRTVLLDEKIALLTWAYGIVEQMKIQPILKIQAPLPSSEQNTVATGWKAAITGELGRHGAQTKSVQNEVSA